MNNANTAHVHLTSTLKIIFTSVNNGFSFFIIQPQFKIGHEYRTLHLLNASDSVDGMFHLGKF